MLRKLALCAMVVLVAVTARISEAQITSATLEALSSFGTNGWLAPAAAGPGVYLLNSGATQRGLAFNPATGNVLVAFRNNVDGVQNSIVRFDGTTGSTLGTMNNTGVSGGTFAINMLGVNADNAIYAANLSISSTSNFKVYRWADEAAVPTTVFDGLSGLARTGDSFAVRGSGADTRFGIAGTNATSASNFFVGLPDGSDTGTTYLSVPGTLTTSNDYRLSLTFVDSDTLIGNQGGTGGSARVTTFLGNSATVDVSIPVTSAGIGSAGVSALAYLQVAGTPLLATMDMNNSQVRILDITNPASPTVLAGPFTTTTGGLATNGDRVGQMAWGNVVDNLDGTYSARLYALNANQGVQAFSVTLVPEPSTWAMLATAAGVAGGVVVRRRRPGR